MMPVREGISINAYALNGSVFKLKKDMAANLNQRFWPTGATMSTHL